MPKVSIITASYNYETYITETIESVINQPFQDWELIIVDDGSKDNSVNVIKSYCQKDDRIKLYQHKNGENKGLAETLKLGVNKSQAEWIVFLESDDTISPDYFEEKFNIINKNPQVDFIFNNVNMFGDLDIISEFDKNYLSQTKPVLNKLKFPTKMFATFQKSQQYNLVPTFSSVMLKKYLLENLDFNSPAKPYLDWYLWAQIINKYDCYFYYSEKKLTNWRMHSKSYINTELNEVDRLKFKIKKDMLLNSLNITETLFNIIQVLRRQIIRLHLRDGECFIFNRKFNIPFLSSARFKKSNNR